MRGKLDHIYGSQTGEEWSIGQLPLKKQNAGCLFQNEGEKSHSKLH